MSLSDYTDMDRNKDGCGPSCEKHRLDFQRCGKCRRCGGMFMAAKWFTKEEAAEIERKSEEKKMIQKEREEKKQQEENRKKEAKQNEEKIKRVVLINQFARVTEPKNKSPAAEYQANRRDKMSEDKKERAKEKDKIRKRQWRQEESIYETTEDEKVAVAARMAKCRHNKDEEKMNKEKEKATLGMRDCRKRKKEDLASEDGHSYTPRTKRMHSITRKNVKRRLRYIKETGKCEELINYYNTEKQEWLFMNPSGDHYRKKHYDVWHVDDDDDYEIVDLVNKDYMDVLVLR